MISEEDMLEGRKLARLHGYGSDLDSVSFAAGHALGKKHRIASELPPAPEGTVWLTVAVPVPPPSEGGWDRLPPQQRWTIGSQVREAVALAYGGYRPPDAIAQLL